jgi:predicted ATPase
MARLDRLGPAKEVAQIGSAIGREFSHALLASVARKLEATLARLPFFWVDFAVWRTSSRR